MDDTRWIAVPTCPCPYPAVCVQVVCDALGWTSPPLRADLDTGGHGFAVVLDWTCLPVQDWPVMQSRHRTEQFIHFVDALGYGDDELLVSIQWEGGSWGWDVEATARGIQCSCGGG